MPFVKVGTFFIVIPKGKGDYQHRVIYCNDNTDCVTVAQGLRLAAELEWIRRK